MYLPNSVDHLVFISLAQINLMCNDCANHVHKSHYSEYYMK